MRKWIILIIVLILVFIGYKYLYKSHRDIANELPSYVLSTSVIQNEFLTTPFESEKKYLNTTIEVRGLVTHMGINDLTLDNVVFCQFNSLIPQSLKIEDSVNVKGRCIGYDDLLEQVKMDQCDIVDINSL